MEARESSLAIRAAWLCYVHGLTQAEAADHLGISRVKVHRLVARAHEQSWVKVFVEGSTAEGIALEQALKQRFGLQYCNVVPSDVDTWPCRTTPDAQPRLGRGALPAPVPRAAPEGVDRCGPRTHAGGGRRRAAEDGAAAGAVRLDPRQPHPTLHRESVRRIYRFAERTGGAGYFVPAPFFVDSIEDAEVLRGQRVVKSVLELARKTDLVLVGIGNLRNTPAIYDAERKALAAEGIVGEVLGQFLDRAGGVVNCVMAQRSISLRLDELRGRAAIGVAGGADKVAAIAATLRSGLLSGLVTDEATARAILRLRTATPQRASRARRPTRSGG